MANQIDGGRQTQGAVGGIDQEHRTLDEKRADQLHRQPYSPGRDDTIDPDLERERLEPGLNAGGEGEAGADPSTTHSDGNSNT